MQNKINNVTQWKRLGKEQDQTIKTVNVQKYTKYYMPNRCVFKE